MSDDFDGTDDTSDQEVSHVNSDENVHIGDEARRLLSVFSGADTAIGTQALFLLHPPAAIATLHPSHLLHAFAQLPTERQIELRNLAPGIDAILDNMRMTLSVEEQTTLSTSSALVQQHQMDLDQEMVERQRFHLQIHAQLQPMCRQFNDSKANAPISPDWDTVVLGPSPFHILPAPDAEFQYDDSFSDTMPPDLNGRMLAFEPLCECIVKMLFSFGDAEEPSPAVIITLIDYVRDWLTPVACLLHRQIDERSQLALLERHFPVICNMYFSFRQLRCITSVDSPPDEPANALPEIEKSDQINDPTTESTSSSDTLLDIVPDEDDEHAREAISRIAYESVITVFDHQLPVGPLCRQRNFASLLTRTMSHAQYLNFARARTTSFLSLRNLPVFSQLIGAENMSISVNRLLGLIAWDRVGILTEVALYLHQQRANAGLRLSVYDIRLSLRIVQNWSWLLPREPSGISQSIASPKRIRNKSTRPVSEITNASTDTAKRSRKRTSSQADLSNVSLASSPPASTSQPVQRRVSARVADKKSTKPL